LATPIN